MADSEWPRYDLLTHRAETTPERTALIDADRDRRWSYRELDAEVGGLAAGLDAAGVSLGTRVGVLLSAGPAFVRTVHAIARLGGVLVPLNLRQSADQLAGQAERAEVDLAVCSSASSDLAAEVGIDPAHQVVDLRGGSSETLVPIGRDVESLAVIMFTSGTTGDPKGVRLTRRNLLSSAEASAYRLGVAPDDRWLCCLPMYHMGGLAPVFRTALYGTTLVVQRAFDAAPTADVLRAEGVTGVSLVPTMLQRLLEDGWHPPESLDTVLLGGAPASESLIERCAEREVPVYPTYGTTETASQIATATPEQARAHPGTVGQPLVNTTVRVVDDGGPVERGETGELVVSGPTVTPGYLDAARTTAAFSESGLHTGDVGYRDADGRLWVVGRVDDLIVTGGENVAPTTVAEALESHESVEAAAVVGVPDEEWGERVAALVVGSAGPSELDAHCRERLADYQCPKQYAFGDEIPRTASGTVDREAVRERLSGR